MNFRRRTEKDKWLHKVTNEEVLRKVYEKRSVLNQNVIGMQTVSDTSTEETAYYKM